MNTEGYSFGFNGMEKDNEWAKQDYGMRIYDKRIGKFLSVDPLTKKYPELTPYQFAGNNPLYYIDIEGAYKYPEGQEAAYRKNYPKLTKFLETDIKKMVTI